MNFWEILNPKYLMKYIYTKLKHEKNCILENTIKTYIIISFFKNLLNTYLKQNTKLQKVSQIFLF
jgi:hypothetical protein